MSDLFEILQQFDDLEPKKREDYKRAPFGWPGGKWQSLTSLYDNIPSQAKTWVDCCGGSGVVTLNLPGRYDLKVFNDRHSGVTTFYRCLHSETLFKKLVDRLRIIVHSREEFVWSAETWENCTDDVERAARWYYSIRFSFGQLGRNFARVMGSDMLTKKYAKSLRLFPTYHEVFKNCLIENLDVIQIIQDFAADDTVFYIDPDYIGSDPYIYKHRVQHETLCDTIFKSKGYFALSGYANPLYEKYPWTRKETWKALVSLKSGVFNEDNHLSGKQNVMGRDKKAEEVLWIKEWD